MKTLILHYALIQNHSVALSPSVLTWIRTASAQWMKIPNQLLIIKQDQQQTLETDHRPSLMTTYKQNKAQSMMTMMNLPPYPSP